MEDGVYSHRLWPDPLLENAETRNTYVQTILLGAQD